MRQELTAWCVNDDDGRFDHIAMSARATGISKSTIAIYAATAGNLTIAVTNFVVAAFTAVSLCFRSRFILSSTRGGLY